LDHLGNRTKLPEISFNIFQGGVIDICFAFDCQNNLGKGDFDLFLKHHTAAIEICKRIDG
jgi:hypothetical protein